MAGVLGLYRAFRSFDAGFDAAAAGPAWAALERSGLVTVVVAELGGVLVATCTLAVVPNLTWWGRPYAVIENVATDAGYRRAGHGRAVLTHACGLAWAAGCYKVTLATGSVQEGTLRFYEQAGFVRGAKSYFEMRAASG